MELKEVDAILGCHRGYRTGDRVWEEKRLFVKI